MVSYLFKHFVEIDQRNFTSLINTFFFPLYTLFLTTASSCRGWLNKVGSKPIFSNLRDNKRWFVFDRQKQMFVYYSNKTEKKIRGGAYFQAINDVYFDHTASERTFIVKTKSRSYSLQASSTQACAAWIDVLITGALGKILFEYEK